MYCIIDIETTGNGLKGNRITEISIFKLNGLKVVDEFTSLVNPECPIPQFITSLTGIDNTLVHQAPTFTEIAKEVLEITQESIFVAHAVNFDYGVIKEEFKRLGIDFSRKKLCTVRLSRKLFPGFHSYSLGKLCTSLGIPLSNRHRARGDAKATVLLFSRLLQQPEAESVIKKFLNSRSQEATLPPHLDKKAIDGLPNQSGIYYFLNQKRQIIYVGKAKNLKKRVLGHFYDKSEHEIKLCREVAAIDFELSGSELLALLMESAAIKKHWPKYNRAQKKKVRQYGIFSYEDRLGILHLGYGPISKTINPICVLSSITDCRTVLNNLCQNFNLCPRYCQLVEFKFSCPRDTSPLQCTGICRSEMDNTLYNSNVNSAIESLQNHSETQFIKMKGRTPEEDAVLYLKNGLYQGYGFVPKDLEIGSDTDLESFIDFQENTRETQFIVESYLQKRSEFI